MEFKVKNEQDFIDYLNLLCIQNSINLPNQWDLLRSSNFVIVRLSDQFIARLKSDNPKVLEDLITFK